MGPSGSLRDFFHHAVSVVVQHAAFVGGVARMLGQLGLRRRTEAVQSLSAYLAARQGG